VCCAVYDPGDIVTGYFESQSPGVYPYGVIVDTATAGLAWSQTFTGVSSCGLGGELALILPPLIFWRERRRRGA
jgi:hypothetical protein